MIKMTFQIGGKKEQVFNEWCCQNVLSIWKKNSYFQATYQYKFLMAQRGKLKKNRIIKVLRRKCRVIFLTIWWGKSKQNTTPEPERKGLTHLTT